MKPLMFILDLGEQDLTRSWVERTLPRWGQRINLARAPPICDFWRTGLQKPEVPTFHPSGSHVRCGALLLRHSDWYCSAEGVSAGCLVVNVAAWCGQWGMSKLRDVTCLGNGSSHFWLNILSEGASLRNGKVRPLMMRTQIVKIQDGGKEGIKTQHASVRDPCPESCDNDLQPKIVVHLLHSTTSSLHIIPSYLQHLSNLKFKPKIWILGLHFITYFNKFRNIFKYFLIHFSRLFLWWARLTR